MPFPFLVSFALMIASFALTALLTPRQKIQPASIEEFDFPQVEEGTEQAVFFGDCWTAGWQVVWFGNMRTKKIRSKGKK